MGFFTGSTIQPVAAPPIFPGVADAFQKMMGNWLSVNSEGYPMLVGADPFLQDRAGMDGIRASLYTPTNDRLAQARAAWAPWDAGTSYMASYLNGGAGADPSIGRHAANVMEYGNVGGFPGQAMNSMVQYGAAGQGPGQAMSSLAQWGGAYNSPGFGGMKSMLQYGAPSQAGQFVSNMAQFGTPSAAGQPMHNRAMGAPSAALSYLTPFMNRMPASMGSTPSIPTRQLYRNDGRGPVRLAPGVGFNLPSAV